MLRLIKEMVKGLPPIRLIFEQRARLQAECEQLRAQVDLLISHNTALETRLQKVETSHNTALETNLQQIEISLNQLTQQIVALTRSQQEKSNRLSLSEIPIDTRVSIENLSTYKIDKYVRFSGTYTLVAGKEINRIAVYSNGAMLGEVQPSELPGENSRHTKQFCIDVVWTDTDYDYEFHAEYTDDESKGFPSELVRINVQDYVERERYIDTLSPQLNKLPMPPGDVVFQTQGTANVTAYKNSIPVSMFNFKKILDGLGYTSENLNCVLDFGCGTGRLLCGWQTDRPGRDLYGVDYNDDLIAWASENLPSNMHFLKNDLYPPLNFADDFFDCIYLVSVFTHLTLRNQFLWLEEFRRILKKGQPLLISLHGPDLLNPYRIHRPHVYREIVTKRYWDNSREDSEEGANPFISFHMPDFAAHLLFSDWKLLGYYPGGKVRNQPLASGKQDIYVLTY